MHFSGKSDAVEVDPRASGDFDKSSKALADVLGPEADPDDAGWKAPEVRPSGEQRQDPGR